MWGPVNMFVERTTASVLFVDVNVTAVSSSVLPMTRSWGPAAPCNGSTAYFSPTVPISAVSLYVLDAVVLSFVLKSFALAVPSEALTTTVDIGCGGAYNVLIRSSFLADGALLDWSGLHKVLFTAGPRFRRALRSANVALVGNMTMNYMTLQWIGFNLSCAGFCANVVIGGSATWQMFRLYMAVTLLTEPRHGAGTQPMSVPWCDFFISSGASPAGGVWYYIGHNENVTEPPIDSWVASSNVFVQTLGPQSSITFAGDSFSSDAANVVAQGEFYAADIVVTSSSLRVGWDIAFPDDAGRQLRANVVLIKTSLNDSTVSVTASQIDTEGRYAACCWPSCAVANVLFEGTSLVFAAVAVVALSTSVLIDAAPSHPCQGNVSAASALLSDTQITCSVVTLIAPALNNTVSAHRGVVVGLWHLRGSTLRNSAALLRSSAASLLSHAGPSLVFGAFVEQSVLQGVVFSMYGADDQWTFAATDAPSDVVRVRILQWCNSTVRDAQFNIAGQRSMVVEGKKH